ncbi:hypothetical protein Q8F57_045930 [Paraburkholderia terrae]|uniref:hypothetical protein n=1 Tax=Paraburkholderia terrae TaxID=311230 RepID=UPI0037CB42BE
MTRSAFYRHFASKEDLVADTVENVCCGDGMVFKSWRHDDRAHGHRSACNSCADLRLWR